MEGGRLHVYIHKVYYNSLERSTGSDEIDDYGLAVKQVIASLCYLRDCLLHKTLQ